MRTEETRYFKKGKPDDDDVKMMYVRSDIGKRIDKAEKAGLEVVGIEVCGISWDIGLIVEKAENGKI